MPLVMCNSGHGHPKEYRRPVIATEADENKDAILDLKIKRKRNSRLRSTKNSHHRSAKEKSTPTNDFTPRQPKKKANKDRKSVKRIDGIGDSAFNDIDLLPTVLPDYSTQYEDKEPNERKKERVRKIGRVHRPWHSPEMNSSDSDTPGGCCSPVTNGRHLRSSTISSPVLILPGDPTPPGLYGYTPLGFNGYLRCTFKCVYCSKLFESASSLYEHCNGHHYGDKPYECPFCEERFAYSMLYAQHLNGHIITKSFPTFRCELCSIGFSSEWELKLHSPIHTDNAIY
uniref:Zinc finger and SCAN domain-containing protein 2 n=1 Tax=Lygus hesperus TaxID=30085 RepID=A0A146LR58_LYGHE